MNNEDRNLMGRRDLLAAASVAAAGLASGAASASVAQRKPNIVFILADDMGYADLSCYGSAHIKTPYLDELAAGGVRFTDAYANSPVCSPSRLALITGCYNARFRTGLVEPFGPGPWGDAAIPAGFPTFPKLLQKAGYRTALVGKWHLGPTPEGSPLANGYDEFYGFLGGAIDYFTHEWRDEPALRRGDKPANDKGYMTSLLADEAIKVVERNARKKQPFCLSLHFNAPHWPWEGPEDSQLGTLGAHVDGGSLETYAEMMESMDRNIGRLLRALDNEGVAEDTLVIFTSDNGGERFSQTWPFRGEKGYLLEGGIRVPAILRFPGRVAAGSVSSQHAATMDWAPTMLDAAGAMPAKSRMDGMSMLTPLISGRSLPRALFWKFQGHRQEAARVGQWKYYRLEDHEYLFDLSVDTLEKANKAEKEPEIFADLKARWREWNAGMVTDDTIPGYCLGPDFIAGELSTGEGTNCISEATPRPTK